MSKLSDPQASTVFGKQQWSPMECRDMDELLAKKLGKDSIASRTGAGSAKFSYIESWKVIQMANSIFGFNGWSCSIVDISPDFIEEEKGRFCVGVTAVVRITLKDGTFHEDVGYGTSDNNGKRGLAIEKAKKEAVSDARKRAMRLFGNALGNCLYDKAHLKRIKTKKGNEGLDIYDPLAVKKEVQETSNITQNKAQQTNKSLPLRSSPPRTIPRDSVPNTPYQTPGGGLPQKVPLKSLPRTFTVPKIPLPPPRSTPSPPAQNFQFADFDDAALEAVEQLHQQTNTPTLVHGQ